MLAIVAPTALHARIQTYQIVRLLSYKTDCQLARLDEKPPDKTMNAGTTAVAFVAVCDNVTFYPHGIDILCADRDDEQTCRILTDAMRFEQLDLLRKAP